MLTVVTSLYVAPCKSSPPVFLYTLDQGIMEHTREQTAALLLLSDNVASGELVWGTVQKWSPNFESKSDSARREIASAQFWRQIVIRRPWEPPLTQSQWNWRFSKIPSKIMNLRISKIFPIVQAIRNWYLHFQMALSDMIGLSCTLEMNSEIHDHTKLN